VLGKVAGAYSSDVSMGCTPGPAKWSQSLKESKEEVAIILKVQHRSEGQVVDVLGWSA
jgi:hypothetical protein